MNSAGCIDDRVVSSNELGRSALLTPDHLVGIRVEGSVEEPVGDDVWVRNGSGSALNAIGGVEALVARNVNRVMRLQREGIGQAHRAGFYRQAGGGGA